jgi:serine-type D-Ala-D-Ala carboxypeptidase/endopeptidase (penicillin-binding protein 4)
MLKKTIEKLLFFALILGGGHLNAQIAENNADSTRKALLQQAIQNFTSSWITKHAAVGICVEDIATGQRLAAHNPDLALAPASNTKILTTAAALGILGNEFRFQTELQMDGEIRNDTLFGNIFLKGGGDPTLGSPTANGVLQMPLLLDDLSMKVKNLGIKHVKGQIVGDGTAFESGTVGEKWLYEDLGNYYGAGVSGLNLNENLYYLRFQQSANLGETPKVASVEPSIPHFKIMNEVVSAQGGGDNATIFGVPYSGLSIVRGTIPKGNGIFSIRGAVTDPPLFAAHQLRERLKMNGITSDTFASEIERRQNGIYSGSRQTLHVVQSQPLSQIVQEANQESINLWCEAMLKAIAAKDSRYGSAESGVAAVRSFWASRGVATGGGWHQIDGSGLSPQNAVSAANFVGVLKAVAADNSIFPSFYASLPRAGESGTMSGMLKKTVAVGRLRAKSGTLTRVKCYSGYITKRDGQMAVFSIMVNNFDGSQRELRVALEKLMVDFCNAL